MCLGLLEALGAVGSMRRGIILFFAVVDGCPWDLTTVGTDKLGKGDARFKLRRL